jgi:hypothetical protein
MPGSADRKKGAGDHRLSSATSAGVGMLASEAGLGGFVSSLAASLAGAYVNAEVMPQRNFSDDPNWKPTGLGSTGSVEFDHDGRGFHAINVDFNQQAFNETIDNLKSRIFEECLDQNIPVEDAMEIVEEQVAAFTEEAIELAQEAKELQKPIIEEAPASPVQSAKAPVSILEETEEGQPDQQSRLESANFTLQMANVDPLAPQNQMEADLIGTFREFSLNRIELTPQEKVLAYEPKNPYEAKVKDLTIFKHKVLDFINRHPEAAEMGMKLLSGVAHGWQAIKYAGAAIGGFVSGAAGGSVVPGAGTVVGGLAGATTAVSGMYATQTATEAAIDTTVTSTSNALAANITSDSVLQKEFASTIKICELGLLCVGSAKAAKALKKTVKTQASALKQPNPRTGRSVETFRLTKSKKSVVDLDSTGREPESWQVRKAKIHGKAQKTGTKGHDWESMRQAIRKTKDPDVVGVHMDQTLSRVTEGKVSSRMRPDVSVVRKDGRVSTDEVRSKSQKLEKLQEKIDKMQDLLPPEMRGRDIGKPGEVFDPMEGK